MSFAGPECVPSPGLRMQHLDKCSVLFSEGSERWNHNRGSAFILKFLSLVQFSIFGKLCLFPLPLDCSVTVRRC